MSKYKLAFLQDVLSSMSAPPQGTFPQKALVRVLYPSSPLLPAPTQLAASVSV